MSFNTTIDDVVWSQTTDKANSAEKPFLKKEWGNPINDTNTSSNYASNQITFDTTIYSNSGSLISYSEGLIRLPVVIRVQANGGTTDFTNDLLKTTDFMLGFKNSHLNIIDRFSIQYNNIDIMQPVPLSNAYLIFLEHSEFSEEDEKLNRPLTGYGKDNSTSWYYNTPAKADSVLTGDSRGCGLGNNCNMKLLESLADNDRCNLGLLERQQLINKFPLAFAGEGDLSGKSAVLGDNEVIRQAERNHIVNQADGKYIFYDVCIRLKDLAPNLFKNFPLTLGSKFKITLTLNNNISFQFKKNDAGNFIYDYSTFVNATSTTNPLMLSASYDRYRTQVGRKAVAAGGDFMFELNDATSDLFLNPCGNSTLPCVTATTYTVTMRLGKVGAVEHPRQQCIITCPSYKLSPLYESQYFSPESRVKKIHYTDLEYQFFSVSSAGSFNKEISSSCVRPKRLILIPFLTPGSNFGLDPLSSPFTTEPSTTSPCVITGFNCSINNANLYPNDINYTYDHFVQNLNGQQGVNANMVNGLVSGRINFTDFENNYHYIVCDLSRRLPEQDLISNSVKIRGKVSSAKELIIHCYLEVEKVIEIDVMTGALIKKE